MLYKNAALHKCLKLVPSQFCEFNESKKQRSSQTKQEAYKSYCNVNYADMDKAS